MGRLWKYVIYVVVSSAHAEESIIQNVSQRQRREIQGRTNMPNLVIETKKQNREDEQD